MGHKSHVKRLLCCLKNSGIELDVDLTLKGTTHMYFYDFIFPLMIKQHFFFFLTILSLYYENL